MTNWDGLTKHEIQFKHKVLMVQGSKGVIVCGYFDINAFEETEEACVIISAPELDGVPDALVLAITSKAKDLGIKVGMRGQEVFDLIR
jgi:uncharacterized protein YunC (DUF1805 family)